MHYHWIHISGLQHTFTSLNQPTPPASCMMSSSCCHQSVHISSELIYIIGYISHQFTPLLDISPMHAHQLTICNVVPRNFLNAPTTLQIYCLNSPTLVILLNPTISKFLHFVTLKYKKSYLIWAVCKAAKPIPTPTPI